MIRRIIYLLIFLFLAGCINQNDPHQIIPSPAISNTYETISPTLTTSHSTPTKILPPEFTIETKTASTPNPSLIPTVNHPNQSPTPIPSDFPTPLPNSKVIEKCLPIIEQTSSESELSGILVLGNEPGDKPYLLNLHSNDKIDIPFSQGENTLWLDYASVSPDGNWLAFIELLNDSNIFKLHLMSNQLVQKQSIELEGGWGKIVNWLDNQRILLSTSRELPEGIYPKGEMAILNPFTSSWEVLSPNLPKQISIDPMPWQYWKNPIVFYNPSLSQAIYLSVGGFLLIDTNTESIVKELRTASYMSHPTWSPHGDTFAMVIDGDNYPEYHSEIYLFDNVGGSHPLTSLGGAFGNNNVGIETFQWSPDGKKIAFTYFINDMKLNEHFALVDINSGQIVDYCLPSIGLPPVWSPDSQSIAFASGIYDGSETPNWQTVVINTVTNKVYKVAQTMLPLGWMVEP